MPSGFRRNQAYVPAACEVEVADDDAIAKVCAVRRYPRLAVPHERYRISGVDDCAGRKNAGDAAGQRPAAHVNGLVVCV